ncbi:chaperone protein dnaJ 20, chloroplastic-like [Actinidia eriantha]|uniref:chaperone protein dnaJ 20, chloroplastic-like n=1 Tax=Actinidia eriantha TaxID=165200 RepID=UPI002585056E|nr:chaperone protein dnaJ 20, chloroplastic-like [Actinidia eriantha]
MAISLSSNLNGLKPCFAVQFADQCHRPITISCKAIRASGSTEANNLYELLSLRSSNAGMDEIKTAYRAMALKYHPDVCDPLMKEESARMFVEVHEAYKTLSDPVARAEYDLRLSLGDFSHNHKVGSGDDPFARRRWEGQITELRRRSSFRGEHKEGSWGSRMRARNTENGVI